LASASKRPEPLSVVVEIGLECLQLLRCRDSGVYLVLERHETFYEE
jgi:hypothetical protein